MFRPIGRGKVLGREMLGYVAQSESIVSSELRMAHLFIQKYMNNSLILNNRRYIFVFSTCNLFFNDFKEQGLLFLVTMNYIFVVAYSLLLRSRSKGFRCESEV